MAEAVEKVLELGLQEAPNLLGYGTGRSDIIKGILETQGSGRGKASGLRANEEVKDQQERDRLLHADASKPLPRSEIEIAQGRIKELHPLQDAPVGQALPYFCCCLRLCARKDAFHQDVQADEEELKVVDRRLGKIIGTTGGAAYQGTNIVEDERAVRAAAQKNIDSTDDIFNGYGYGVVAYHGLLRGLIVAYALMCVFAYGMMRIYDDGDALEGERMSFITKYTLGNMGFVQSECVSQFLGIRSPAKLECSVGTMSDIIYTGLKPNKHGIIDIDGHLVGNDFCGDPAEFPPEDNCSALIDIPAMKNAFQT